jgi:asparagine synthase (glutamine-hydrolysing)
MCGIAGCYSITEKFTVKELEKMSGSLRHRGPDSHGFFMEGPAGLAHTRLSILDLSARGNQPMHSHNKRYVMVYNGEVYNYKEIANELMLKKKREYQLTFSSSSDSEVILEAFATWGPEFVHKLNGMFAIAIYDRELYELHIFRDRLGIKPLYYYHKGEDFFFGSELKALMATGAIDKTIDNNAVTEFLNLGFIPAPLSIYAHVKKLEPGSYLKITPTGVQRQKFWSIRSSVTENVLTNEKQALVKLSDLLMSSVQYQLKSDVPFGVFLSGGIDSSLITAQAVNLSNVKINTFSIGFEENKFDESVHAAAISKFLGTNHYEFIVSYKDALSLIDELFETYSEPFSDSSAIPTMLVSKLAKQHVTVTLSGEGGDELFFGYGAYKWARRLDNPVISTFRKSIHYILSRSKDNRFKRAATLFDIQNDTDQIRHIFSQEQYLFTQSEIDNLVNTPAKNFQFSFDPDLKRDFTSMEDQAIFDLSYYLPDDLLTKVDRASMRYSLETRVPYLDHRIVEFALNLSPSLKYKNGTSKYILKEILYQYIPEKYFARPKQGFAIPLKKWLNNELSFLITENLSKTVVERFGFVKYEGVETLIRRFRAGEDFLYNRIWLLIVLHRWAIKNLD